MPVFYCYEYGGRPSRVETRKAKARAQRERLRSLSRQHSRGVR